jgi:hypothetical protein
VFANSVPDLDVVSRKLHAVEAVVEAAVEVAVVPVSSVMEVASTTVVSVGLERNAVVLTMIVLVVSADVIERDAAALEKLFAPTAVV